MQKITVGTTVLLIVCVGASVWGKTTSKDKPVSTDAANGSDSTIGTDSGVTDRKSEEVTIKDEKAKEAEEFFRVGEYLFDKQEYKEAAQTFSKAYKLSPHPAVLANMGLCYEKSEEYVSAYNAYKQYLDETKESERLDWVESHFKDVEQHLGRLIIDCQLNECQIELNGRPVGDTPLNIVVDPGSHMIHAFYSGRKVDTREVYVGATEVAIVALVETVNPIEETISEERSVNANAPSENKNGPEESVLRKLGIPFWVATGLTVASATTLTVFGIRTLKDKDRYDNVEGPADDIRDQGETNKLVTNIMIGVTAACAGTAVVFAIIDLKKDEYPYVSKDATRVEVVPGPGIGLGILANF